MSFDPYGNDDRDRARRDPPDDPTAPADYPPDRPDRPKGGDDARGRVTPPAILLIVVGVLNLLAGGYFGVNYFVFANASPEMRAEFKRGFQEAMKKQDPKQVAEMEKLGYTPERVLDLVANGFGVFGVLGLVSSLLGIIGGIRMLQLRNYGLCVFASIVSAIPCVSPAGCCCIGEAAGIYALVVLLGSEVRASFR